VTAGSNFAVELTADPIIVPTTGGGYNINNLRNVVVKFNVPAGAQFVGATLSGGANLGSGAKTVALSGSTINLTIAGPLAPGTTATLPKVTATLKATGAVGTQIGAQLHGTSYADPGISFTANVAVLFGLDVPTNCFASPNPVLATTTIN